MPIKILLTTPDYPPKLGGLSTFTKNLEKALKGFGEVTLYVWDDVQALSKAHFEQEFDWGVHVHFMGGFSTSRYCKKNLNFVHGSEITFTSPHFVKKLIKNVLKSKFIEYFHTSHWNVFISKFTQDQLVQRGLQLSIDRDLIFHNLIELDQSKLSIIPFYRDEIRLVCIARDVPHKNIDGAISMANDIQMKLKRKVVLTINAQRSSNLNSNVKMNCVQNMSDEMREQLYQEAHFNLLPSLNHSRKGFFEGFGLTVLEAGKFGTPSIVYSDQGGQGESVHHLVTGWSDLYEKRHEIGEYVSQLSEEKYNDLRLWTFNHTVRNHDSQFYKDFLKKVIR